MDNPTNLGFNPKKPFIVHIDINSCFATCEQQANPFLRNKPLVVAAFDSAAAVILASSIEAKRLNIKTGMRVFEAKKIYPNLTILEPDPAKYRTVHDQLKKVLLQYTPDVISKSIDEFVCDFSQSLCPDQNLFQVCREIKQKIKTEIGDWISVSIGIGPNRFLSKIASNLKKPDGLEQIYIDNYQDVYSRLRLKDLHGVNTATANLLNCNDIYTVLDFYNASLDKLKSTFQSICSYYWYLRLRGWEIDDIETSRQSFGNMHALKKPTHEINKLKPILHKLVLNTSDRLRSAGWKARGVRVSLIFSDHTLWQKSLTVPVDLYETYEMFIVAFKVINCCPGLKPVINIAFSCFNLNENKSLQLNMFQDSIKKDNLVNAIDSINNKFGNFSIIPASIIQSGDFISDHIGFGKIK